MRRHIRILLAVALVALVPLLMGPTSARSYVTNNYLLMLDGANTGFVKSVEGGSAYAEVINEAAGPSPYIQKHIGKTMYEDFTMQVGFAMGKPVYDWIAASWQGDYARKNGSVVAVDMNMKPISQRQFFNALLTEVTVPACDGTSTEPAYLTVKFAPEYIRAGKPDRAASAAAARAEAQKTWIPSNFRLEIDGLDATKVNKIDAFTVKQKVLQDSVGDARDAMKEPGKLEFPNLTVTLPESAADTWQAWFEDFVIKGNSGQDKERNGTLDLLATDRQTVLARIRLYNIGIARIAPIDGQSGTDAIRRVQVELYVERMEFEVSGAQG